MYKNELDNLIDNIVTDISDYNIANLISKILIKKYKYIGNNKWQYYNSDKNIWIYDKQCKKLTNEININFINILINRINYYNKLKENNCNNIDICNNYDVIISKFLFIINKLYNKKYLNSIIKEVKPFLSDDIY
jgi:hypothetical protein